MKVAFLDRDGVINKEKNYLYKIEDWEYTENCVEGLKQLNDLGFEIIVITNQAGIARGYYSEADYQALTDWYVTDLKEKGIDIFDVYFCPHHPSGVIERYTKDCTCRKPKPGMLIQAIDKYKIKIEDSILIGDKVSDLAAGASAGVQSLFLVSTGHKIDLVNSNVEIYESIVDVAKTINAKTIEQQS